MPMRITEAIMLEGEHFDRETVPVTGKVAYLATEAYALLEISRTDEYRKVKSGEIPKRRIRQRILIPAY